MRVYQLKIDGAEESEVICPLSRKADAEAAIKEREPFGGCGGTWGFDYAVQLMDAPTTKTALIEWLNTNARGKRIDEWEAISPHRS